jgi:hypothetical protein
MDVVDVYFPENIFTMSDDGVYAEVSFGGYFFGGFTGGYFFQDYFFGAG